MRLTREFHGVTDPSVLRGLRSGRARARFGVRPCHMNAGWRWLAFDRETMDFVLDDDGAPRAWFAPETAISDLLALFPGFAVEADTTR